MTDSPILFLDGTCGLCNRTVDFLIRRDRHHRLRFAPLQGSTARVALANQRDLPDSLVLVAGRRVFLRSDAALRAVAHLGGVWALANGLLLIPRALRDGFYDWVAAHRVRWFGQSAHCRVPTEAERDRFLP